MKLPTPRSVYESARHTFKVWTDSDSVRLAAALSYYTIFSIGPLLLLATAIAGLFFGEELARSRVMHQLESMVGTPAVNAAQTLLIDFQNKSAGKLASIVGIALLLLGATGIFLELKTDLNRIFDGKPERSGWRAVVCSRVLSFVMVILVGALLVVSLGVSAAAAYAGKYLETRIGFPVWVFQAMDPVISFAMAAVLFAMIFKILPDAKMQWREVWVGGALTSFLFTIGKFAVGYYLGKSAAASAYGASASIVILLLWTYYSALIFFMGAAFIKQQFRASNISSPAQTPFSYPRAGNG